MKNSNKYKTKNKQSIKNNKNKQVVDYQIIEKRTEIICMHLYFAL